MDPATSLRFRKCFGKGGGGGVRMGEVGNTVVEANERGGDGGMGGRFAVEKSMRSRRSTGKSVLLSSRPAVQLLIIRDRVTVGLTYRIVVRLVIYRVCHHVAAVAE